MTLAPFDPDSMSSLGFEDTDARDMSVPRIKINHADGTFEDSVSGEVFDELNCIILGLVKQRVMWHSNVEDGDVPQCKSTDFETGYPNVDPKTDARLQFPWEDNNFEKPDLDEDERPQLPCASCVFKEWGTDKKPPPCAEQHTYVIIYQTEDGDLTPALFTTQKTGLKNSRAYLQTYMRAKKPMFTNWTVLKLDRRKRGSVTYSVPTYIKGAATEVTQHTELANTYISIRDMVRQPPRDFKPAENPGGIGEDDENTVDAEVVEEPKKEKKAKKDKAKAKAAPAPEPEPPASDDDDDDELPF